MAQIYCLLLDINYIDLWIIVNERQTAQEKQARNIYTEDFFFSSSSFSKRLETLSIAV